MDSSRGQRILEQMNHNLGIFLKGALRRANHPGPALDLFGFVVNGIEGDRIWVRLSRQQSGEVLLHELRSGREELWIRVPYEIGERGLRSWAIESAGDFQAGPYCPVQGGDIDAVRVIRNVPLELELKLRNPAVAVELLGLLQQVEAR